MSEKSQYNPRPEPGETASAPQEPVSSLERVIGRVLDVAQEAARHETELARDFLGALGSLGHRALDLAEEEIRHKKRSGAFTLGRGSL